MRRSEFETNATLSIQRFIQILEHGRVDLLNFLSSRPFGVLLYANRNWVSKALKSQDQMFMLIQNKKWFNQIFHYEPNRLKNGRLSPVEIYFSSQFSDVPRAEFVMNLFRYNEPTTTRDILFNIVAISRALYRVDQKIDKYTGKDYFYLRFVKPEISENLLENDFVSVLYDSFSNRTKAVLNSCSSNIATTQCSRLFSVSFN